MKKVLLTSLILLSVLFGALAAQEKAADIAKDIFQQNLIRFYSYCKKQVLKMKSMMPVIPAQLPASW